MNVSNLTVTIVLLGIISVGCKKSVESFTEYKNPAPAQSKYPHLFTTADTLYMSWITTDNDLFSLQYANYSGNTWSSPNTIARDSSWFVNWADFPSIIAGNNGPMAAHWLNKKSAGTYAYDVNISLSTPKREWSTTMIPYSDSTATEHGFASMIPWDKDTILVVWLDGRQSTNRSEKDYFDLDYAMTLRGALISRSGEIERKFLIDKSVCDCCQTSLIKTTEGAMVAYRNRTENEIRDIYTSRFDGTNWTAGRSVNSDGWKIGACPVNGPRLAVHDSLVGITWHTAADKKPLVKAALSVNNGKSFSPPLTISNNTSLGRVDIAFHKQKAYLSWLEKAGDKAALNIRSITKDQELSKIVHADSINPSRKSGFPQLEVLNNQLIIAWTNFSESVATVKTIRKKLKP